MGKDITSVPATPLVNSLVYLDPNRGREGVAQLEVDAVCESSIVDFEVTVAESVLV